MYSRVIVKNFTIRSADREIFHNTDPDGIPTVYRQYTGRHIGRGRWTKSGRGLNALFSVSGSFFSKSVFNFWIISS